MPRSRWASLIKSSHNVVSEDCCISEDWPHRRAPHQ
jgi:hypothetical protein